MLPNNEVRVPPPRAVAQPAIPRDITAEFTEAASSELAPLFAYFDQRLIFLSLSAIELRTGQLVKDEMFTLFEAVGALEVRHGNTRERSRTQVADDGRNNGRSWTQRWIVAILPRSRTMRRRWKTTTMCDGH